MTLRTHRLLCREPLHSDADAVLRIYGDVRTSARSPLATLTTAAAAHTLFEAWAVHWRQHGWGTWAIACAQDLDAASGLREVHSMVLEANPASIRVMEKLGMRHVGQLAAQHGAVPSLHYRLELAA